MSDTSKRLFEVACIDCRRTLMTVARIRDPEIAVLVDHLRACSARERLGDTPRLGEIMAYVRVAVVAHTASSEKGAQAIAVKKTGLREVDPRFHLGPMGRLYDLVFALLEQRYDAETCNRFSTWLCSVRPTVGHLAIMMVEMALSGVPTGAGEYRLVGFSPAGEPLIDCHSVQ